MFMKLKICYVNSKKIAIVEDMGNHRPLTNKDFHNKFCKCWKSYEDSIVIKKSNTNKKINKIKNKKNIVIKKNPRSLPASSVPR